MVNILLFNIRDKFNPTSGGAEVFTHEVLRRWANSGNEVTMIVSDFKYNKPSCLNKSIDNINIIRLGNMLSVYWLAKKYYNNNLIGKYDIIIDEYTFKPFITPKFVKEPIIFLCHELAREKYFYELPPLASHIFYHYLEPNWLKNYINIPTVTVSNSTKQDLISIGFKKICVVPEGINFKPISKICNKEKDFTMIFVGLLKKSNLVDHAIEAFKIACKNIPNSKLWIVGRGPELEKLKVISKGSNITFFGFVSDEKKLELMEKAHVLLVPAIREGWGLVVTEANACGTPAVGYDVPGLRDSIRNNDTGILTESNPKALADSIMRFHDDKLDELLSKNALSWSRNFTWDKTANEFMRAIEKVI